VSPLLAFFWPVLALGLTLGAGFGTAWLRRKRLLFLLAGILLAAAGTAFWHGPAGAAERFTRTVETSARATLVDWEMGQVHAHLHHGPLTRRLDLSGPADDFQRSGLVGIMGGVPGVSGATWDGSAGMPLILEALLASAVAFVVGLFLAYVVELRRRYNAQWRW
jgi:hypothetical protein